MNRITISQEGAISRDGRPVSANLLKHLNYEVSLEEGFTLRSYFRMLDHHPQLAELNEFIPGIREQFRACAETGCTADDIEYLEFSKTIEMIGFPSEPRLEIYNALRGKRAGEGEKEIKSYLLEQLLDIPVRLGGLKHVVFGDKVDVFEFETVFNLFDFVDGIIWELSFQSTSNACAIRR